jgi:hypothetical protein
MSEPEKGAAHARYDNLVTNREPFLIRARQCATLTIPYLMPPMGFTATSQLPTPYQSLGARGVRTLAAKLLLSLFPPNTPFFKFEMDDFTLRQLESSSGNKNLRGEVEIAFSARERATTMELENSQFRVVASLALQHLIATGNFLIHVPETGRARGFRLDQYVVKRDPVGNVLEVVVKECVSPTVLPKAVQDAAKKGDPEKDGGGMEHKTAELYTHIKREADKWSVQQEANGVVIVETKGTYPLDRCPWVVLRLATQPGEDYGRAYVEEFLGDLDSLEGLSETLVEGSAAAARIIFLVKPNGVTQVRVISKARTGDVHVGDANDVTVVQSQKQADLGVAREQAQDIAQRLSYAFLLNASVQRNAERVTAEEIKFMASELDDALGGMYALLSSEFQLPTVTLYEDRMERVRKLPALPKGVSRPVITTGMAALGRGIDLRNLKAFTMDIVQTLGPEVAFRYLQPSEYMKRAAASYGIDTVGLIKSEDEIAREEQIAQLQALAQNLGPNAVNALGGVAKEAMKGQTQDQNQNGQSAVQPGQAGAGK